MLIVALVLAVIGLAALVTAVVTSNELIAWVCIAASAIGVILLIVDAVRDRSRRDRPARGDAETADESTPESDAESVDYEDYPQDDTEQYGQDDDGESTVVEQADSEASSDEKR